MIYTLERHIEQLEINKKLAIPGLRQCQSMKIGQIARQGDLYFHRVPYNWPRGNQIFNYQLAVGNTKGSRHIADNNFQIYEGIKFPDYFSDFFKEKLKDCLGPVVVISDPTRLISHPEHSNFSFDKDTILQVTYQCNLNTMQRVID